MEKLKEKIHNDEKLNKQISVDDRTPQPKQQEVPTNSAKDKCKNEIDKKESPNFQPKSTQNVVL